MNILKHITFVLSLSFFLSSTYAAETLKLQKVTDNVYAIVGELVNRTEQNLGNNATFGVVVTSQGVVLVDSGGTYKGAQAIHDVIKTVTNQPIVKVINSGGQDHRWLGNGYFKSQGAEIIASSVAVKDQKTRAQDQFIRLGSMLSEQAMYGTEMVHANITFEKEYSFELGGIKFEITHSGQAHTPGDSFIWLPQKNVMFTGDIVYVERVLGVGSQSNSKSWLSTFETMAKFNPKHIVPGHGSATTLEHAKKDTYEYLTFLRATIADFMDNDGDISEISKLDLTQYNYLFNYDTLAGRNAQKVFTELEWE